MVLLTVVFSVLLAFPFGSAEASALSTTGGLTFEVRVEVLEPASAVLVRGRGLVDELPPVSLVDQEDGTWAGIVEIPVVEDIMIGFELIPDSGPAVISELHPLTEYGVDPAVFEEGQTPDPVPIFVSEPAEAPDWLWLVLAGGAALLALGLIWLWVRWGRTTSDAASEADIPAGDTSESAGPDGPNGTASTGDAAASDSGDAGVDSS